MAKVSPTRPSGPHRYQTLIQSQLPQLSTAEQAVAAHLSAHPEQLPFETAESVAKRLGVSAMTVGRTLKALGYRGLGELRAEMRSEIPGPAVPWVRRGASPTMPALKSQDRLRALRAEIEAIEAVHALADTPPWRDAVKVIAAANQVLVAGFQTERGIAMSFADQLAYVRPGVRYLSVESRAFADLGTDAGTGSCLVIVDGRRYSRWFRLLARRAVETGIPLIMATDAYCRWAADLTPYAFQARTDSGRFWDNNAPIASLLNLLIEDVIESLGDAVHTQLDAASEFGAVFVGFDRVQRERGKGGESPKESDGSAPVPASTRDRPRRLR